MNLKIAITSAAFGAAVMFGGAASAATVTPCGVGSGIACLAANGTIYSTNAGGGDPEALVELAVADALSLTSVDLTLLGKSDASYGAPVSGLSGSWSTPDAVDYITVKAGSLGYILYSAGGLTSGSWSTMGLLNGGGNQPAVSHISYWSGAPTAAVPLPAAGMLLLTALGGFAAFGRRKA